MNEVLSQAVLLLCALAGIVLLLGVLVLLGKRIIVLDQATGRPMEFEFPILGKFKTQSPVVALAIIGALLVGYSVHERRVSLEEIKIEGEVDGGGKTVSFVVVAFPRYQFAIHRANGLTPFKLTVPKLPDNTLRVRMYVDETLISDQEAEAKSGRARLREVRYQPPPQDPVLGIAPRTRAE